MIDVENSTMLESQNFNRQSLAENHVASCWTLCISESHNSFTDYVSIDLVVVYREIKIVVMDH